MYFQFQFVDFFANNKLARLSKISLTVTFHRSVTIKPLGKSLEDIDINSEQKDSKIVSSQRILVY